MAIPWRQNQRFMDAHIDLTWGEPFEIHPWVTEGYTGAGAPDAARTVLKGPKVIGVYMTPGSRVVGETADSVGQKQVVNECWVSVQQDVLGGDLGYYGEGDRVYFPDRDEWYEILYVAPSATFRPNIMLTRVQEVDE